MRRPALVRGRTRPRTRATSGQSYAASSAAARAVAGRAGPPVRRPRRRAERTSRWSRWRSPAISSSSADTTVGLAVPRQLLERLGERGDPRLRHHAPSRVRRSSLRSNQSSRSGGSSGGSNSTAPTRDRAHPVEPPALHDLVADLGTGDEPVSPLAVEVVGEDLAVGRDVVLVLRVPEPQRPAPTRTRARRRRTRRADRSARPGRSRPSGAASPARASRSAEPPPVAWYTVAVTNSRSAASRLGPDASQSRSQCPDRTCEHVGVESRSNASICAMTSPVLSRNSSSTTGVEQLDQLVAVDAERGGAPR